ncbi:PLP-dependent aminotransferase family protein [Leucobacter luti]|uniref:GntR family transcriptional regulator n=1 Tax=Leucobacter luti TaxID=340320 RepID=A0A4V6MCV7_9MICO|nr:PLP-dependent aminotransferase family protein [Leucobacter luti]MBL3698535.1 PLP-dependent aminotransferase family protein [Leucobacter luti]RZT65909.1 GntR family transcriptional regulator [Leucobacter luti]
MIAQRLSARRLTQLLGEWRGSGHGYEELGDSIGVLVRDGAITPGTALPAERPLADELGVSRTTVAASYRRLRETGTALSRRGSGTVVRSPRPDAALTAEGPAGSHPAQIDLSTACPASWAGLPALGERALAEFPGLFAQPGYDTIGLPELRQVISDRFTRRGLPTVPEQIMVTLGAQHAIFLVARTLLSRGDRALIESPSYPHAREALAATGALVAELPVGRLGSDEASVLDIAGRVAPRLAYLIPDHHNPTGLSMPRELRSRLIHALSAAGTHVIADETTAELVLGESRLVEPFAAAAELPHQCDAIITVGSLGKTVWGGLRVGWIRATPDLIARLEASRRVSDLGTGAWEQATAALALERYDDVLDDRRRELTAKHRVLSEQLAARLPGWAASPASGGVCTWVDIGEPRSSALSREAASRGVRLTPGPRFGSPGVFERFVRLPFTAPEAELVAAVELLAAARVAAPARDHVRHDAEAVI